MSYFVTVGPCEHGVCMGPCRKCQQKMSTDLLERDLQAKCVAWWKDSGLPGILFHVPNEGKRTRLEAAALQALGVVAGAPDFVLLLPCGQVRLIELKTEGGEQSAAQIWFESEACDLEHSYRVVRSLADFRRYVWAFFVVPDPTVVDFCEPLPLP